MSSYHRMTKNPASGVFESALWIDDYYGHHHYGVQFPNGSIVDPREVNLQTREHTAEEIVPMLNKTISDQADYIRTLQVEMAGLKDLLHEIDKTAFGVIELGKTLLQRRK